MSLFNPTPEELNPDNFKYEEFFSKYGDEIWENDEVKHEYEREPVTREEKNNLLLRTQPLDPETDKFNDDIGYENTEHGFYWFFNNPRTPKIKTNIMFLPNGKKSTAANNKLIEGKECYCYIIPGIEHEFNGGIVTITDTPSVRKMRKDGGYMIVEPKNVLSRNTMYESLRIINTLINIGNLDEENFKEIKLGGVIEEAVDVLSSEGFLSYIKDRLEKESEAIKNIELLNKGMKLEISPYGGFMQMKSKGNQKERFVNKLLQKNLRK